jgi:palmitoyltransferase
MTTLDEITENQAKKYTRWMKKKNKDENRSPRKENGIRFVNVAHDNIRLVVPYDIRQGVFNTGFKKNCINLIFNGNRNHGYRGSYGYGQLVLAFLIFLCPFIDTYFAFKYSQVHIDDSESAADHELAKYMAYSSQFNDEFMEYIKTQILNKQCHLPLYVKNETEKT